MKDYYVVIEAENSNAARELMFAEYADKWSFQYDHDKFDPTYFPAGIYEIIRQPQNVVTDAETTI